MFFEQYAGELIAFATGIAGVVIGKITNRKRERVDVQELEVRITDKLLKIILGDIVEPLREELLLTREELKRFKNAIKKRYTCRLHTDCPITVELQKQADGNRPHRRKPVTNRQREPVDESDDPGGDGSAVDGGDAASDGLPA